VPDSVAKIQIKLFQINLKNGAQPSLVIAKILGPICLKVAEDESQTLSTLMSSYNEWDAICGEGRAAY